MTNPGNNGYPTLLPSGDDPLTNCYQTLTEDAHPDSRPGACANDRRQGERNLINPSNDLINYKRKRCEDTLRGIKHEQPEQTTSNRSIARTLFAWRATLKTGINGRKAEKTCFFNRMPRHATRTNKHIIKMAETLPGHRPRKRRHEDIPRMKRHLTSIPVSRQRKVEHSTSYST